VINGVQEVVVLKIFLLMKHIYYVQKMQKQKILE